MNQVFYSSQPVTIINTPGVTISGTPTVNIGTMPSVSITGNPQVVGNVASGAADSGNPVKVGAVYNVTNPSISSGQRVDLQATLQGWLKVQEMRVDHSQDNVNYVVRSAMQLFPGVPDYSPTVYRSLGTALTAVVRNGPTNLYSFYVTNSNAAPRYLHIVNSGTAMVSGATVGDYVYPIAVNDYILIDTAYFTLGGRYLSTALQFGISNSPTVYNNTGVVATEHLTEFNYK